jgi:WD40 repeat protein
MAASTAAKEEISKLNQMLTVARETAEKSRLSWLKQEQKVQQLMRDAGLWVSFSKEIAPILHARCLACHNANQTEGGLSLATYSALMAGGESGSIIDPVDRAASLLCTLLEDGSMPKDADPLTPMQKATVKKWVLGGARLDSGVDSQAPLIELMPRVKQPNAPASYRAPLPITALAFSPDGKMLASSGYHEVLVWSAETQSLQKRISNVAERVYDIAYSPDGLQLAVAAGTPGQLGEVKVFDAQTGGITADLQVSGDVILGVSYSPDGKRLASCGADGTLRVFNLQSQTKILQISAHADWVNDVNWSADGQRLVSCGRDKTVKIFDAQSGDSILSFSGHTDVVTSCFYLPDGNQLVTSGADRVLRISNASDASEIRKIGGFSGAITQLLVLPDSRVVTASIDKNVRIHQAADGKPLLTFEAPTDEVLALAANVPTGTIATGSLGGEIRLVKISDGKIAKKWLAVPPAP